jgi:hypothetical protein
MGASPVQALGKMKSKFGEFAADFGRRHFEGFVSVHTVYWFFASLELCGVKSRSASAAVKIQVKRFSHSRGV